MRLKYYLRGAGIGIIVTAIIFMIALAFHEPQMSDEDVIARAKTLGMVMSENKDESNDDVSKEDANKDDANKDDTRVTETGEAASNNTTSNDTTAVTGDEIDFSIAKGENSATIVQRLLQAGLIDDEKKFNTYLHEKGYDNLLQPGDMKLSQGMTYEEIAQILTTKPENRQPATEN